MTIVPKAKNSNNNNNNAFSYLFESSNIWHSRLGFINYDTLCRLSNLVFLPKFDIDYNHKCEIWVESKMTGHPFNYVSHITEPLDLIHSDIFYLKFVQTRGGKKYFITFVDDCTRCSYAYLLRSKDETVEMFKLY